MATTRIDINDAVNPVWLIKNKCALILPKNTIHKIRISSILWERMPKAKMTEQIKMFLECTEGISERHLYRYYKHNFTFNNTTVGTKVMKDEKRLEQYKKSSFVMEVRDLLSGVTRYHFKVSVSKIEEFGDNSPKLDVLEINELRNNELKKPAIVEDRTPQEIDDLGMKISKLVATGIYSVYDACNECGVKWIEFMDWYVNIPYIYELYNQALTIARFFKNSSYESLADKMLFEMLSQGTTKDTAIEYERLDSEMYPEGFYVPIKKHVLEKGISMRDLINLRRQVQGSGGPIQIASEFETMGNDELAGKIQEMQAQINKKYDERQKKLNKNNK